MEHLQDTISSFSDYDDQLWNCPEPDCRRFFQNIEELESYCYVGTHTKALESYQGIVL
jgi:hypothetical protein